MASVAARAYPYDAAGERDGHQTYLPTINPASNTAIPELVSMLNIEIEGEHQFTLYGIDDSGAFTEPLTCFMPANTRATFTVVELEAGTTGCMGPPWQKRVGGKWAIWIVSEAYHISQGGMLSLQTGILANVSDGLSPQFEFE
ncbi:MAG: hypothetical protein OXP11_14600 [Gammaproteobacteria bacterium]|nr:hypothetical protein [Gammaproteobacteria bacterium]